MLIRNRMFVLDRYMLTSLRQHVLNIDMVITTTSVALEFSNPTYLLCKTLNRNRIVKINL